jgi:hypothetical protein
MSILAVVPARMGSERMPRKNACEIEPGLSLVQHAIDCAMHSMCVDDICVSTDAHDLPIHSAHVAIRPRDLSGPTADIRHAVQHAALEMAKTERRTWDYVVTLQPAVLARSPLILRRLMDHIRAHKCRGGLTMAATHRWIWTLGTDAANDWHPGPYPRSQDSAARAVEINAIQVATWDGAALRIDPLRWDTPLAVAVLPPWCAALDIDTPADLAMARDIWPWAKTRLETCVPEMHIIKSINGY